MFDPLISVGGAFLLTGAVAMGVGIDKVLPERREICGTDGSCVESSVWRESVSGTAILVGGITSSVAGIVSTTVGAVRTHTGNVSSKRTVFGAWLVGAGVSVASVAAVYSAREDDARTVGAVTTLLGAGTAVAGVVYAGMETNRRERERAPKSETEMSFGIALATAGAAMVPATIFLCHDIANDSGDFAGFGLVLLCFPTVAATTLVGVGGAALWADGARNHSRPQVSFDLGPGGAYLRGEW